MARDAAKAQEDGWNLGSILIAIAGIVYAFIHVYEFAQKRQPGNAMSAAVILFVLSFLLATKLAKMRQVSSQLEVKNKGGK